jgi:hypothetical protein
MSDMCLQGGDQPEWREPRKKWSRKKFKKFMKKRRPKGVNEADDLLLGACFEKLKSLSPTFALALDWALYQDVRFIIDREMAGSNGVYKNGMGVVCISSVYFSTASPADLARTFTHEIRHAWQDTRGLLPYGSASLAKRCMRTAVYEADTFAYGELAAAEVLAVDDARKDQKSFLQKSFKEWFFIPRSGIDGNRTRAEAYGQRVTAIVAKELGVNVSVKKKVRREFSKCARLVERAGVDLSNARSAAAMGQMWRGGNYLLSQNMQDFLTHEVLSPTRAGVYYAKGAQKILPDVCLVRKEELKCRLYI